MKVIDLMDIAVLIENVGTKLESEAGGRKTDTEREGGQCYPHSDCQLSQALVQKTQTQGINVQQCYYTLQFILLMPQCGLVRLSDIQMHRYIVIIASFSPWRHDFKLDMHQNMSKFARLKLQ